MNVAEYLNHQGVHYEMSRHRPTFTAQQVASEEHIPGMHVAKPVVINADGTYYLCVLPACCKIDMDILKELLDVQHIALADESELSMLFSDCALGSEPPFGQLYGLETLLDETLKEEPYLVFQAGSHEAAVRMSVEDYLRLVSPRILKFSYHCS